MAQPAISRHIKELEEELGRQLFLRQKKKVQLTQAGRELLMQISPLLSEFDRIFTDFNLEKTIVAGVLKVGSIAEAGTYIYMDHLIGFQKDFPNIEIRIEFGSSDYLLNKISTGELDFALVSRFQATKALETLTLFRDHPVLVGSNQRRKLDLDNSDVAFVFYREDDYYTTDFLKRNVTQTQRKNIHILGSVSSHEAMLHWIIQADAFCVVPHSSVERSRYRKDLRIFKEDEKETSLNLIYLKNSMAELRKKIFLDQMYKISLSKNKSNL